MNCVCLLHPQMATSPAAPASRLLQLKLPSSSSSSPNFPSSSSGASPSSSLASSPKSGLCRSFKDDHDSAAAAGSLKSGAGSNSASSLLKRKRPPKLSIPAMEGCSFQVEECIRQEVEMRGQAGENFAMACKKGRRRVMEDTFAAVPNVLGDDDSSQAFYGVFDGHGGQEAAEFVAQNLLRNILDSSKQRDRLGPEATRIGYHATDCHFLRQGLNSGASCLSAGIAKGRLVVANAGDCRAVLVKSDGAAVQLTRDHRLSSPTERRRIESLGGVVDCYTGTWRVQGVLAVSRGIGDRHLKQFISSNPDVFTLELTSDCRYLILASDGLWDMVSNQDAVNCVLEVLRKESNLVSQWSLSRTTRHLESCSSSSSSSVLVSACRQLVELSLQRGCLDDITVLIVDLRDFSAD